MSTELKFREEAILDFLADNKERKVEIEVPADPEESCKGKIYIGILKGYSLESKEIILEDSYELGLSYGWITNIQEKV